VAVVVTKVAYVERGGRDGVGRYLPGVVVVSLKPGARCRTFNYCLTLLIKQSIAIPDRGPPFRNASLRVNHPWFDDGAGVSPISNSGRTCRKGSLLQFESFEYEKCQLTVAMILNSFGPWRVKGLGETVGEIMLHRLSWLVKASGVM
jgi:hypothetical protein